MKHVLLIFLTLFSHSLFAGGLTPTRSYEHPVYGPTDVYEFPDSNVSDDTIYKNNQASIGEYSFPWHMVFDPEYVHTSLQTEKCEFIELDREWNNGPGKAAIQLDSRFYVSNAPYVMQYRIIDTVVTDFNFTLQATRRGNGPLVEGRRLEVSCSVNLENVPVNALEEFIQVLISDKFET